MAQALILISAARPVRILCAREQQNSISESVHRLLSDTIARLGMGGNFDIQRDKIICASTGSTFFFEGIKANVDRIKSYEGVDYCWVEEAHKVSENSWKILIPTIRKETADFQSEIWITFNPELETDYTYKTFVIDGRSDPDTVVVEMNWRDNPWFPRVLMLEMEKLKAKDYDAYLNVWEGKCRILLEGAVYATELRDVIATSRITRVPYDPAFPVDCFWDLGRADLCTIWFRQKIGFQYRYIDYLTDSQKSILWYMKELQGKGYLYGTMWLPHDARAQTIGAEMSVERRMRKVFSVRVVKRLSVSDGIDAARTLLPICVFDESKCAEGIRALGAYHYEVIEEKGTLSKVPVHDWASHGADSFRYSAVATGQPRSERLEEQQKALDEGLGFKARAKALASALGSEWGFGNSGGSSEGSSTSWMK